jgi:hypothetical protein
LKVGGESGSNLIRSGGRGAIGVREEGDGVFTVSLDDRLVEEGCVSITFDGPVFFGSLETRAWCEWLETRAVRRVARASYIAAACLTGPCPTASLVSFVPSGRPAGGAAEGSSVEGANSRPCTWVGSSSSPFHSPGLEN